MLLRISLLLLPIILLVGLYGLEIITAGRVRAWAVQWRRKADTRGGLKWVILRITVTVLVVVTIMALIQRHLRG